MTAVASLHPSKCLHAATALCAGCLGLLAKAAVGALADLLSLPDESP